MKKQLHCSQVSPVGWYIASFIERTDPVTDFETDQPAHKPRSVWENRILVKASTPDEALARTKEHLTSYGGDYKNTDGIQLRGTIVGLSSLIPIHDELEDGAEIEFLDHTGDTIEDMRQRVRDDTLLEAFTSPDDENQKEAEQGGGADAEPAV